MTRRVHRARRDLDRDGYPDDPGLPALLLTVQQVATICQVAVSRVRDWTNMPGFPVIRTPHLVRIHTRLLEEWLAEQATHNEEAEEEEAA